jgi:hypothetical protein
MAKIIPIRDGLVGGTDGGGPEDPMVEQRVGKLEEKVDRIEAILARLEPKIMEILHAGAKQAELNKVQLELLELKSNGAKQVDLNKAQVELAEVKGRVASLPTWWMLIIAILSTWGAGFAIANSVGKAPVPTEKSLEKAPK